MAREISDELLVALADGELPEAEAEALLADIENDPEAKARFDAFVKSRQPMPLLSISMILSVSGRAGRLEHSASSPYSVMRLFCSLEVSWAPLARANLGDSSS